jgi:hypothetical protein
VGVSNSQGGSFGQSGWKPASDEPLIEPLKKPMGKSTKISSDFKVTQEMVDWFVDAKIPVDPNKQTELFIDYYLGTGKTMKDWFAAWRNWMRKAAEYQKTPWDKSKEVAAVESKAKMETDKQYTQRLLEQSRIAAESATPPPKCEHGESILRCKKCPNGLS